MSDEIQDLDEMLGFLAEDGRQRRDPEEHPSPEELSAYQANELTPEEDERIQDHLAVCQHCTELLLDLEEFLQPPAVVAEPAADFEAAADWKRLREGMGPGIGTSEAPRASAPERRNDRVMKSLRMYRALAAVLGFIALGLTWQISHRSHWPPLALQKQKTLDFSSVRGGSKPAETLRLPYALRFYLGPKDAGFQYRIEISDSEKLVYSAGPYGKEELENLVLPLDSGRLPPGNYTVSVYRIREGQAAESLGQPVKLAIQP